jgi:hypothetical protein
MSTLIGLVVAWTLCGALVVAGAMRLSHLRFSQ